MDQWQVIVELLALLGVAFFLGAIAERLKQSAIVGYLLAGFLLGPFLFNAKLVFGIAEIGVALLLFSIGLEFSLRRLKSIGAIAIGGGSLQVVVTLVIFAAGFAMFKPLSESIALGAMVALSSTACVLKVLVERAELDSVHGRNALGILLLQDIAVVPLVLLVTMLGHRGEMADIARAMVKTFISAICLIAIFYAVFHYALPRILEMGGLVRNRELIALLAILIGVGSAGASHKLGLSPALGAFLAGLFIAESPFAAQIRADAAPLRIFFVTLFFSSIGMLAKPTWIAQNWWLVLVGVVAVFLGKTAIVYAVARLFRSNRQDSLATGFTLAQVGEFSFVIATAARVGGVIGEDTFFLATSVTVATLLLAPFMASFARPLSEIVFDRRLPRRRKAAKEMEQCKVVSQDRIFIIGFGPAGQRMAELLLERDLHPTVIEQNPSTAKIALRYDLQVQVGDASRPEVLQSIGVDDAAVVVVTVPDTRTARRVIEAIRAVAPCAAIVARARYNMLRWELEQAGARVIVDEEVEVGQHLAAEVLKILHPDKQTD